MADVVYEGRTFETIEDGTARAEELGFPDEIALPLGQWDPNWPAVFSAERAEDRALPGA